MATYYALPGLTNLSQQSGWSLSSGGASANAVPGQNDDVIFDANSGASRSFTTTGGTLQVKNLTISGTSTFTFNAGIAIWGASVNVTAPSPTFAELQFWNNCTVTGIMTVASVFIQDQAKNVNVSFSDPLTVTSRIELSEYNGTTANFYANYVKLAPAVNQAVEFLCNPYYETDPDVWEKSPDGSISIGTVEFASYATTDNTSYTPLSVAYDGLQFQVSLVSIPDLGAGTKYVNVKLPNIGELRNYANPATRVGVLPHSSYATATIGQLRVGPGTTTRFKTENLGTIAYNVNYIISEASFSNKAVIEGYAWGGGTGSSFTAKLSMPVLNPSVKYCNLKSMDVRVVGGFPNVLCAVKCVDNGDNVGFKFVSDRGNFHTMN